MRSSRRYIHASCTGNPSAAVNLAHITDIQPVHIPGSSLPSKTRPLGSADTIIYFASCSSPYQEGIWASATQPSILRYTFRNFRPLGIRKLRAKVERNIMLDGHGSGCRLATAAIAANNSFCSSGTPITVNCADCLDVAPSSKGKSSPT